MFQCLQVPGEILPLLLLEQELAVGGMSEVVLDVLADGGVDGLQGWLRQRLWLARIGLGGVEVCGRRRRWLRGRGCF